MKFDKEKLLNEVEIKAVLSGGPGGQHANKANTKVVLEWNLEKTTVFSEKEIMRLQKNLKNRLTKEGIVQMTSEETRSQYRNKIIVTSRFVQVVKRGLRIPKTRKKPKPGKKFHERRLTEKRHKAEKKDRRRNPLS